MERLNYRERRPPADSLASANRRPVFDIDDVDTLAQGIVESMFPFSSSIRICVLKPQTALFVRRSG